VLEDCVILLIRLGFGLAIADQSSYKYIELNQCRSSIDHHNSKGWDITAEGFGTAIQAYIFTGAELGYL